MKFTLAAIFLISIFNLSTQSHASTCGPQASTENFVSREDFPWGQSLKEINLLAQKIYKGDKRIRDRAYTVDGTIILPIEETKVSSWGFIFDHVLLQRSLIDTFKSHIQKIRSNNYGQELIYSDIGHAHIFASLKDTAELKAHGLESSQAAYYETILHSSNTKYLYHTSEQLGVPQDKNELWRKENRTVIGDSKGEIKISPFTKSIKGYSQFFSVYFNANRDGCFSLDGLNFDLSLSSPK